MIVLELERNDEIVGGGLGYHSCKAVLNTLLSSDILFWRIVKK